MQVISRKANKMLYLYSSLTPYAKTMSGNFSSIEVAQAFINLKARSSFGFSKVSTVPVEVAAVDAHNDPIRGREEAVELELPLHVLVLAVGHRRHPLTS
ncbi:Os05g0535533, partial [Oryza sativa Japonica Group]